MSKEYVDYKEISMDIKGVIFDIVESEKKTISILDRQISNETDEAKKEKLEAIKKEKDSKLEDILSKVDSVVENIKIINDINIKNNLILDESDIDNDNKDDEFKISIDNDESKEETTEDKVITEEDISIEENTAEESKEETNEDTEDKVISEEDVSIEESTEEETVDNNEEEENEEDTQIEEAVEGNNEEVEETENDNSNNQEQEILYAFNKDTKILPKAIMVKQTDQFPKLKSSCDKQIEKLTEMSVFEGYDYKVSTAHSLQGNVIDEDIEKELDMNESKYDDVERYIEDLTVKASIYTDQGEIEKANAVNKKIDELKNRGKVTNEE